MSDQLTISEFARAALRAESARFGDAIGGLASDNLDLLEMLEAGEIGVEEALKVLKRRSKAIFVACMSHVADMRKPTL